MSGEEAFAVRRRLSILGSTGSIGRQSLEVMAALGLSVGALTAHRNAALLEEQVRRFRPELAVLADESAARDLAVRLADTPTRVAAGRSGLLEAATLEGVDTVLTAVVGIAGAEPTLAAIRAGKDIALANKETLVCAGALVTAAAREAGVELLPVDSEHSAIFQCLQGCADRGEVERILLTASGGPFYGKDWQALSLVTKEQALQHPNWSMGAKITVDSATMMNKGFEVIEAMWLYDLPLERIDVVIHRESVIHSLVEFRDGAVLAQLGVPDMRLPIQYALTWPRRLPCPTPRLDLLRCPNLTFLPPDGENFPCLDLARQAARRGGVVPAALNGANEAAVALFLEGRIGFCDIPRLCQRAVAAAPEIPAPSLEDVLSADAAARADARSGI